MQFFIRRARLTAPFAVVDSHCEHTGTSLMVDTASYEPLF